MNATATRPVEVAWVTARSGLDRRRHLARADAATGQWVPECGGAAFDRDTARVPARQCQMCRMAQDWRDDLVVVGSPDLADIDQEVNQ